MIQEIVESVQNLFGTRKIRRKPRVLTKDEHQIDRTKVSPFAISVCQKLQDAGYKAFIVGGAVRDLMIGHTPKDFDVATDATPEQVKKLTRRAIIIGKRFRLVHVTRGAETIEVATFRGLRQDGVEKDSQGRVIDDNVFGEQFEDAARRDFTVNAMYYDPLAEEVYDYHNGLLDIRKKRIRMIGDPELRYREDPVRILRAIRIAAKLGFKIDPKTSKPMASMQNLLQAVPEPRLFDEVMKMLMSGASVQCLEILEKEEINENIPLLRQYLTAAHDPFLMKALEKADARVQHGKPISQSFIFATLFWSDVKAALSKLDKEDEPGLTVPRKWQMAIAEVSESPATKGIQRRFFRDMEDIWRLQPRFERRNAASTFKLIEHPRFRAAYDFLLIRASSGEVPHELADWWTAFEEAPADERKDMLRDLQQQNRRGRESSAEEGTDKPKRKRRRTKRKSSDSRNTAETAGESSVQAHSEVFAPEPTPKVGTQPKVMAEQESVSAPQAPTVKKEEKPRVRKAEQPQKTKAVKAEPKTNSEVKSVRPEPKPAVSEKVIPTQDQLRASEKENNFTQTSTRPARRRTKPKSVLLTTPKKP